MRLFLAGASIAILCFLGGLLLGSRTGPAAEAQTQVPPPRLEPVVAPATDPELLRAIEALAADVRALRQSLAARAEPSERREVASASAPAPDLSGDIARLEQVAAQLARNVEPRAPQLARPRDPATTPRAQACFDLFRDLETVLVDLPAKGDAQGAERWKPLWGAAVKRWEDGHRGWTMDQISERYGAPDSLQADGEGPSYVYSLPASDGGERRFVFQSRHGLIYDVDVYVPQP
jgi:hypothetical protein